MYHDVISVRALYGTYLDTWSSKSYDAYIDLTMLKNSDGSVENHI